MASYALGAAKDKALGVMDKVKGTKAEVNWDDLNYPPCIRVFHYDLEELKVINQTNFVIKNKFYNPY